MSYAEKLQRLFVLRGFDQASVAARFGISRSSMSRILSGAQEPKLSLALRLARFLDASLEYLADDELPFEAHAQQASLSDDEWTILKLVRRLGPEEALDRLLAVDPAPELSAVGDTSSDSKQTAIDRVIGDR